MENSLKRALSLFLTYPLFVMAHVEEPHVAKGSATIETKANTQLIHAEDKTVINCKKFNVGKEETVRFIQPHDKARVLCRVTGKQASMIEGRLESNGNLFLVNPYSIYFREGAQVNVRSLVASTLNIKDEDFVKGNYKFFLESDAKDSIISNKGQINAAQDVVFMAPQIINRAVVKAAAGKVAFLGSDLITLNFEGDDLISFAIDGALKKGFIEQAGQIDAGNGFLLDLRVASEMIKNVVNVNGVDPATSMKVENGKIYLVAESSITAPTTKIEGPLVQTAGDFNNSKKVEITGDKGVQWDGGFINATPIKVKSGTKDKVGSTDVSLNAPNGTIGIDALLGKNKEDQVTLKQLTLNGKIIDQNALIKSTSSITYSGGMIFLSGDTHALNSNITYNGSVIIDGPHVNIASGRATGDIIFNDTLDADQPGRTLTIFNGAKSGTVSFNKPISSKGPPLELSIETSKLFLSNIGDKQRIGAEKISIKATNVDFFGTVINAREQMWDVPSLHLKSGQPTIFITHNNDLVFTPSTHMFLTPQTSVAFETHGGYLELSKLSGDHLQSITINTGYADSKIGEIGELECKLGPIHVQSRNIYINGKIVVGSIFMEAQEDICYAKVPHGEIIPRELLSRGEVTLNSKRGTVGTKEFPLIVKSDDKFHLGSKSRAYLNGFCKDDFPYNYPKNPPPFIVFNGNETQFVFNREIFNEEDELLSLAPDLFHGAPLGFVGGKNFTFRRAPIYYAERDLIIGVSDEENSTGELSQAEE